MATLIIVYVAAIIIGLTLRLLGRLQHLEDLLRVCAWCRKIGYKGKWLRMEDYFAQGHNLYTTHGMCPDCLKKVQEDTGLVKKLEIKAPSATPVVAGRRPSFKTSHRISLCCAPNATRIPISRIR